MEAWIIIGSDGFVCGGKDKIYLNLMANLWFRKWLAHPLIKELDINNPITTTLRGNIIRENEFLNHVYKDWYHIILNSLPDEPGLILELGSGGGFLKELIPDLITSDILYYSGISSVIDGLHLPFDNSCLRAMVLVNVFHHFPNARQFFSEATRVLMPGGVISMIEPWATGWSKLIYQSLHHEVFNPDVKTWEFISDGPLSGANGALPWVIFHRDRNIFLSEYPGLMINKIEPMMPVRYLLSGGVSMRSLLPAWTYKIIKSMEERFFWVSTCAGMFSHIVLIRR